MVGDSTAAPASGKVGRDRDFRMVWFGDAVSQAGSQLTVIALPLVAIITLQASSFQVGLLTATGYLAWLLIGLPAGAWVDRRQRRPVLVAADLGRALLLLSVPLAAFAGYVSLIQLYIVALATSVLTTLFGVAYPAYLPHVLSKDRLAAGNARLQLNSSVAQVTGPSIGGILVQALGAPATLLVNVASFLISAFYLLRVRKVEPAVARLAGARLWPEVVAGLRFVWTKPVIRALALSSATFNFFFAGYQAVIIVFLIRVVELRSGQTGVLLAVGSVGGIIGAAIVGRLTAKLGGARLISVVPAVTIPFSLLVPFTDSGWQLTFFVLGALVPGIGSIIFSVSVATFVQSHTPGHLLGRVSASIRVLSRGVLPVGAVIGGQLATVLPIRLVLFVVGAGMSMAMVFILASPIRRLRTLAD